MKVDIHAKMLFDFSLSLEFIDLLIRLSKHHYDMVCRYASYDDIHKGFLINWKNTYNRDNTSSVQLFNVTQKELDICMKILEAHVGLVTKEEISNIIEFMDNVSKLINFSNSLKEQCHWKTEL